MMANMRRDKIEIIEDILVAAEEPNGALKSHILMQANLNFKRAMRYLTALIQNDMVEKRVGKSTRYQTTGKGREFLRLIRETRNFM